jgi:hypothetical protein
MRRRASLEEWTEVLAVTQTRFEVLGRFVKSK